MSNNSVVKTSSQIENDNELFVVLQNSLYVGASASSIGMVVSYCKQAGFDVMQKPVHIVPMWNSKAGVMQDVVMPGIGLYRIQAARTGQYAGVSEPEFGPEITRNLGGVDVTFPQWCKVTVKRSIGNGQFAEFTAKEFWIENYAIKGGREKSVAPNAMWAKRVYGQLAKCAQAQALRMGFPECGAAPTAEEMEGKVIDMESFPQAAAIPAVSTAASESPLLAAATAAAEKGFASYQTHFNALSKEDRVALKDHHGSLKLKAEKADEVIASKHLEGAQGTDDGDDGRGE